MVVLAVGGEDGGEVAIKYETEVAGSAAGAVAIGFGWYWWVRLDR